MAVAYTHDVSEVVYGMPDRSYRSNIGTADDDHVPQGRHCLEHWHFAGGYKRTNGQDGEQDMKDIRHARTMRIQSVDG